MKHRLSPEEEAAAHAEYMRGTKRELVAAQFGVSVPTIERIARRLGLRGGHVSRPRACAGGVPAGGPYGLLIRWMMGKTE